MKKVRIIRQIKSRIREIEEEKPEDSDVEKIVISKKGDAEPFHEEEVSTTERRAPVIKNEESVESLERRTENISADVGDKGTSREFSYVARNVTAGDNRANKIYGPAENAQASQTRGNILRGDSLIREQKIFQNNILDNRPIGNENVNDRNYQTPQEKRRKRMPWEV